MKSKTILVVDDEQNVRQLICKILEKEGFSVLTACNGREGLEIFHKNSIDLIISDIKMPEMSGIEFLHKVKEEEPGVGFILITAFATTETAIDAIRSGAQDYITKPFDLKEIVTTVRKILLASENDDDFNYNLEVTDESKTVSSSPLMQDVYHLAKKVAASDATVLILGETGTGKEVISTAIHQWSRRSDKPMIKVNCGAIPDNLLESELFGYEKGAFTGAASSKPGRFEIADGGTVFLDEIGDISPQLQVKLLRVLQEKTFERLGGVRSVSVNVRIIAATNRNLKEAVSRGEFREDLYYRLNVVPIQLPPLRERKEDIEHLVNTFLKSSAGISGGAVKTMSPGTMKYLKDYNWPGNIRELENIVERCVVITEGNIIEPDCLPPEIISYVPESKDAGAAENTGITGKGINGSDSSTEPGNGGHGNTGGMNGSSACSGGTHMNDSLSSAIDDREREVIIKALAEHGGNKTKTALALGISRRSLHRKIQKYEITEE